MFCTLRRCISYSLASSLAILLNAHSLAAAPAKKWVAVEGAYPWIESTKAFIAQSETDKGLIQFIIPQDEQFLPVVRFAPKTDVKFLGAKSALKERATNYWFVNVENQSTVFYSLPENIAQLPELMQKAQTLDLKVKVLNNNRLDETTISMTLNGFSDAKKKIENELLHRPFITEGQKRKLQQLRVSLEGDKPQVAVNFDTIAAKGKEYLDSMKQLALQQVKLSTVQAELNAKTDVPELKTLRDQKLSLGASIQSAQAQIDNMAADETFIATAEQVISTARSNLEKTSTELSEKAERLAQLAPQVATLTATEKKHTDEIKAIDDNLKSLARRIKSIKDDIATLQREHRTAANQIPALEQEFKALELALPDLDRVLRNAEEKLKELEAAERNLQKLETDITQEVSRKHGQDLVQLGERITQLKERKERSEALEKDLRDTLLKDIENFLPKAKAITDHLNNITKLKERLACFQRSEGKGLIPCLQTSLSTAQDNQRYAQIVLQTPLNCRGLGGWCRDHNQRSAQLAQTRIVELNAEISTLNQRIAQLTANGTDTVNKAQDIAALTQRIQQLEAQTAGLVTAAQAAQTSVRTNRRPLGGRPGPRQRPGQQGNEVDSTDRDQHSAVDRFLSCEVRANQTCDAQGRELKTQIEQILTRFDQRQSEQASQLLTLENKQREINTEIGQRLSTAKQKIASDKQTAATAFATATTNQQRNKARQVELTRKIADAKLVMSSNQDAINVKGETLTELNASETAQKSQLALEQSQLSQLRRQHDIEKLRSELASLQESVDALRAQKEQASGEVSGLVTRKERVTSEKDQFSARREAARNTIALAQEDIRKLTPRLTELSTELSQLESKVAEEQKTLDAVKTNLKVLGRYIVELLSLRRAT